MSHIKPKDFVEDENGDVWLTIQQSHHNNHLLFVGLTKTFLYPQHLSLSKLKKVDVKVVPCVT